MAKVNRDNSRQFRCSVKDEAFETPRFIAGRGIGLIRVASVKDATLYSSEEISWAVDAAKRAFGAGILITVH